MSISLTTRGPAATRKKAVSKKPQAKVAKTARSASLPSMAGISRRGGDETLSIQGRTYKLATKTVARASFPPMSVVSLLGGDSVLHARPHTYIEWIEVIRRGISSSAVDALAQSIRVSQSEFSTLLSIPERTLVRRKKEGILSSEESAKLVRMARVANRAGEVFEDFGAALEWLKSPNASLSGITPMSLLDTEIGAESVMDTLGRIEHGVFA